MNRKEGSRSSELFQRIKKTGEDLTTLEINTIVKHGVVATSPPGNNRLALYYLAGKYAVELERLGNKYNKVAEPAVQCPAGTNLFRKESIFCGGGIFSFRELSIWADCAISWIETNTNGLITIPDDLDDDVRVLRRIEIKALEISRVLEESLEMYDMFNPMLNSLLSEQEKKQVYTTDDKSLLPTELQTLQNRYAVLEKKLTIKEKSREEFITGADIPLDLKHKMIVHKSLDLGTEHIVMQTRISLDGDITTRISHQFADNPKQFVLDMHNSSIHMAVDYWEKIFDALIAFMDKVLSWAPAKRKP